jgi:hypothetical protein
LSLERVSRRRYQLQVIDTDVDCAGADVSKIDTTVGVAAPVVSPLTVTNAPDTMPVCGVITGAVVLPVCVTTAEYGGVPPVMMNWNVFAGRQPARTNVLGVAATGPGGGGGSGVVPGSLVTSG